MSIFSRKKIQPIDFDKLEAKATELIAAAEQFKARSGDEKHEMVVSQLVKYLDDLIVLPAPLELLDGPLIQWVLTFLSGWLQGVYEKWAEKNKKPVVQKDPPKPKEVKDAKDSKVKPSDS